MNDVFHVMGRMTNGVLVEGTTEIQVPPDWFLIGQNRWTGDVTLLWGTAPTELDDWGKRITNHWKQQLLTEWEAGRIQRVQTTLLRSLRLTKRHGNTQLSFSSAKCTWGVRRVSRGPLIPLNDLAKKHTLNPHLQVALDFIADYVERTEAPLWRGSVV